MSAANVEDEAIISLFLKDTTMYSLKACTIFCMDYAFHMQLNSNIHNSR